MSNVLDLIIQIKIVKTDYINKWKIIRNTFLNLSLLYYNFFKVVLKSTLDLYFKYILTNINTYLNIHVYLLFLIAEYINKASTIRKNTQVYTEYLSLRIINSVEK